MLGEKFHNFECARFISANRGEERRRAVVGGQSRIRTGRREDPDDVHLAEVRRQPKRRRADQRPRQSDIVAQASSRRRFDQSDVSIGATNEQRFHDFYVTLSNRDVQSRVA